MTFIPTNQELGISNDATEPERAAALLRAYGEIGIRPPERARTGGPEELMGEIPPVPRQAKPLPENYGIGFGHPFHHRHK